MTTTETVWRHSDDASLLHAQKHVCFMSGLFTNVAARKDDCLVLSSSTYINNICNHICILETNNYVIFEEVEFCIKFASLNRMKTCTNELFAHSPLFTNGVTRRHAV